MSEVQIEALKPFNKTPQGDLCEVGDSFRVAATRADELERLGLAKRADGEKGAPKPANKAAPTPANKVKPAHSSKAVRLGG
ncbi:hypothetical protein [Enterovirga rhinocerotis]|uniref:Uncharacterized protein n=1 Tax=Enterovirga rhinocerotis TaxID=1339210 RepID=A0A4R7BYK6_9HYPH|nr:hypothetical protein [Enterovirga rhinocerotis]TDR89116.1 hypothetical protein EV668_3604 [Enterovirga rhinocerotis]